MEKGDWFYIFMGVLMGSALLFLTISAFNTFEEDDLSKDKPSRYQVYSVEGNPIYISKKDGAFLVDAIGDETHSLMVPVSVKGMLIGKIQIDEPTDTGGVMKTVVRGDVYAYKKTVIYVADYSFDNSYDYAVLKGKDATRVKKIIKG